MSLDNYKIAIIGLGYVGLPLAVEFGKLRDVVGYDINISRVQSLQEGRDDTLEIISDEILLAKKLIFTSDIEDLNNCNVFIITVPTPVDRANRPDLTLLINASQLVGSCMPHNSLVIYESTVYPGATEEICVPVLERFSNKKYNKDFFCGYSPERINPGDKQRRLCNVTKITSGSTPAIAEAVDDLYSQIITAGTHKAKSIKIAEAAKVIENTQRDLNIALMNELSLIFHKLGIDTLDVLEAAGTKWNFLPFRPGLVGGHCIGVDPYYLTHKAQELGYHPEVILAGRRINDGMASHIADRVIKLMLRKELSVLASRILVLGFAFKENCTDFRNTKVAELVRCLVGYNANVDVYDPWVDPVEVYKEFGIKCLINVPEKSVYDAVVIAVAHQEFIDMGIQGIKSFCQKDAIVYDVKSLFPASYTDGRL